MCTCSSRPKLPVFENSESEMFTVNAEAAFLMPVSILTDRKKKQNKKPCLGLKCSVLSLVILWFEWKDTACMFILTQCECEWLHEVKCT